MRPRRTRCFCAPTGIFEDLDAYPRFIDEIIIGHQNANDRMQIDLERPHLVNMS
jgi:hypothetical protein